MFPIDYVAVVIAAIAAFVVGFLMHGPIAGKLWMRLADIHPTGNEKFSDMVPQMLWNLLSNLVSAYVLAVVYLYASTSPLMAGAGVWSGIVCAFWVWLGFNVTATSIEVIWMKKKASLWLFECVSSLLAFAAMGAIIAGMASSI